MTKTLKLDNNGDLDISNATFHFVSDVDKCFQDIKVRLRTWYGEWFLDNTAGVRYKELILVKNYDIKTITDHLRTIILDTENVISCNNLKVELYYFDSAFQVKVSFLSITKFGEKYFNEVLSI